MKTLEVCDLVAAEVDDLAFARALAVLERDERLALSPHF
jgi:hypothetical protein